jgi:hypothetical protein
MEVPEPLRMLVEAWDEAHAAADAATLASLYTPDAILIVPGAGRIAGRAAIAEYYRARLPLKARDQPRLSPRKFFFYPPVAHAAATATGRHGEKHSVLDIFTQQDDGSFLFACSSWTFR